ncbi:hypothetical protein [Streptomyces sp. NPDC002851]
MVNPVEQSAQLVVDVPDGPIVVVHGHKDAETCRTTFRAGEPEAHCPVSRPMLPVQPLT